MPSVAASYIKVNPQDHPEKGQAQTSTALKPYLPRCFKHHDAPESVVRLFKGWVSAADETLNGVIAVNRQGQGYSAATIDRAIKWLTAHHLMMKVERGGGRGVASRYLIRWSFVYETLTQRRRAAYAAINSEKPAGYRITVSPLEEQQVKLTAGVNPCFHSKSDSFCSCVKKRSFAASKTPHGVRPVENSKSAQLKAKNKQQRRLRNEKATRWAMAQLRKVTDDEDALTAAAKKIRRSLAKGEVWIGPEFNWLVARLADSLQGLNDEEAWPESRRDVFSFVGYYMQDAVQWVTLYRNSETEFQGRQREEGRRDPLPASFSCRNAAQPARRQVATADAVRHSRGREQRQLSESYKRAKDLQGALYGERAALVYGGEPVNIGDMVPGFLEKLGGGEGVNAMEGNDRTTADERTGQAEARKGPHEALRGA